MIEVRMRGDGHYSASCGGQGLVIDRALPLILEAIDALDPASSDAVFAIADFGAADGGTSIGMFRALLTELRKRAPDRPITLTHTDLPYNDFSALFRLVHGLLPGREADGLRNFHGVFSFASGTSFHQQIFPDATLSLGFSASAMHWLSRLPTPLVDHVHAATASGAERAAFAAQAATDWEAILLHRARELVPGGQLVFANFCIDEVGRYSGATGGRNLFETLAQFLARSARGRDHNVRGTQRGYLHAIQPHYRGIPCPVRRSRIRCQPCGTGTGALLKRDHPDRTIRRGRGCGGIRGESASSLRAFSESTFFGALIRTPSDGAAGDP